MRLGSYRAWPSSFVGGKGRFPNKNRNADLEGEALQKVGPAPCKLYQRKRGETRVIPTRKVIR